MMRSLGTPGRRRARTPRRRNAYIALAVLLLAGIVLLTMLPPGVKQLLHTRGRLHSAAHILIFTGLAFAAGRTTRSWKTLLLLLAGLVLFGFCTELAEHLLFSIGLEWKDIFGDSVGAVLGLSIAIMTQRNRRLLFRSTSPENPA